MYVEVKRDKLMDLSWLINYPARWGQDYKQVEKPQPVFRSQRRKSGSLRGFGPLGLKNS